MEYIINYTIILNPMECDIMKNWWKEYGAIFIGVGLAAILGSTQLGSLATFAVVVILVIVAIALLIGWIKTK